jgi:hypothetical protein
VFETWPHSRLFISERIKLIIFQSYLKNFIVEYSEGLTCGEAIQKLKDEEHFTFRGTYYAQDTITGRVVSDNEILLDGRLYHLNGWIQNRP